MHCDALNTLLLPDVGNASNPCGFTFGYVDESSDRCQPRSNGQSAATARFCPYLARPPTEPLQEAALRELQPIAVRIVCCLGLLAHVEAAASTLRA